MKLYEKIKRHLKAILATTKYHETNSKVEAINNVIKSIIRRGFGFRNVNNLMSLIYIRTSPVLCVVKKNRFVLTRC
jgi:transposase